MLVTTIEAVKAILSADPTVTPLERVAMVALLREHGRAVPKPEPVVQAEKRILRRAEVARRMGCSLRSVDKWAREGIIRKVKLPGHRRSCGFVSTDVERLLVTDSGPTGKDSDEGRSLQGD
jgi:hypothetical protein